MINYSYNNKKLTKIVDISGIGTNYKYLKLQKLKQMGNPINNLFLYFIYIGEFKLKFGQTT